MNNLLKELQNEQHRLMKASSYLEKVLNNSPEGSLRISKSHNHPQYHRYFNLSQKEEYISSSNVELISTLAQKDYAQKASKIVKHKLSLINKLCNLYQESIEEKVYEKLSPTRRQWVTPTIIPSSILIETWQAKPYQGKPFAEDSTEIYTDKGERVRSKSEKIIADKLYSMNIPYKYEIPLSLTEYGIVYPDFCILNLNTRKEIYWEHFGLMDNPEYCNKALKKIDLYIRSGIFPGEKLITTFETSEKTLDTRVIHRIITEQLL